MKMYIRGYDNGSFFIVHSAVLSNDILTSSALDVSIAEIFDTQLFAIVSEELLQNNSVKFPSKAEPTLSNIIINVVDDLLAAKYAANNRIKNYIISRVGYLHVYDIFEFQLISSLLWSEGFFITDANREAKYIEIIETNRMDLIEALEKYLNIRDTMAVHYNIYDQGSVAMQLIDGAGSLQVVDTYLKNFFSSFN